MLSFPFYFLQICLFVFFLFKCFKCLNKKQHCGAIEETSTAQDASDGAGIFSRQF